MKKTLALIALLGATNIVHAQTPPTYQPVQDNGNRLNLSANGSIEVQQDTLEMRLSFTQQASNPKLVQDALNKEISQALNEAQRYEKKGDMTVKTGKFSVYPSYEKQRITTWTGTAEIILEGTNFALITETAGRFNNLVVSSVNLKVSPQKSIAVKDEVVKEAVANFRQEAQKVSQLFGFSSYKIKDISINYNQPMQHFRAQPMAAMAKSNEISTPIAIQAGTSVIEANVSGTIEMIN